MAVERTFVMIKPDGIQRELIGEIISRFEKKGLKLVALKLMKLDRPLAERQYAVHKGKFFYDKLIEFICSGPVVAMVWEADNAILVSRMLVGSTAPNEAPPGTIRGDFIINTGFNVIHSSDSAEAAEKEINLFFNFTELLEYQMSVRNWLGL
jgi:nucleoside-diphosphate kinase